MQSISPLQRQPLVPTSGNSVTPPATSTHLNHKKRKYDNEDSEETDSLLQETFTAYLLSNSPSIAFKAVTLVARACLPLAWLNTSASASQPSPPVFEATIQSVQEWEQRVLLARRLQNGGLYAIERVGGNTYLACPLHSWVSEKWCNKAAIGIVADVDLKVLVNPRGPPSHARTLSASSASALPPPKSPKKPTNRRGALARKSILMSKDLVSNNLTPEMSSSPGLPQQHQLPAPVLCGPSPITSGPQIEPVDPFKITLPAQIEGLPPTNPSEAAIQMSFEEPISFERLRNQYFEHLYTSNTSLAFYVKGPLSRARAHVRTAKDSISSIIELADHYRQSILPTAKIDLKFKESLLKVVNELPADDDGGGGETQKKKSGKKRFKIGKDSLWANEEGFIRKWWRGRGIEASSTSTINLVDDLRKRTAELRTRETKMQLLLILEVMLLELASARLSDTPAPSDPRVKVESIEIDSATMIGKTPSNPPKKKRDLSGELDTMVDRLCIWHTVSFEDFPGNEKRNDPSKSKSNDTLRDFCKDVLIPFYSVKLPEQIKSLSRKLGGSGISPQRPKLLTRSSGLSRSKSSSSTMPKVLPGKTSTKRTLERVLSEDQTHRHASPPVRSRASIGPVNPIIPSLQREPSERPDSRSGMLSRAVSFSNREVDLVADSKVHEAKRQKLGRLAEQKRELEAAIEALKKPNRGTVAGAFMDEIEHRKGQGVAQLVQIAATPRARRVRHGEAFEPELPPMPASLVSRPQDLMVPSSTTKPRFGLLSTSSVPHATATKRAVLPAIHETPSRGLERKTSNPLALCQGSRSAPHLDGVAATLAPPRTKVHLERSSQGQLSPHPVSDLNLPSSSIQSPNRGGPRMSRSLRPVLFTPIKRSDVSIEDVFRDAPEIPEKAGKTMDRVMGGRGVEMDLDLTLTITTSSPFPTVDQSEDQARARPLAKQTGGCSAILEGNYTDEGSLYAQLGWDDDFDL
ncbi:uncharacterized protein A1O9_07756 [Exophiala aquamarina CBS 119918]|uniref:DNA replication regulator Sld3 C-terminal domain-containing protein n=1 Tax=Exophiala aquamarina CBS 119918 TaxID=1182545 RepID=A0A072PKZ0_9EURO|nr:uncharacterized protein A1O9_07756 [Exophiala aquamarina CBS 119918]KEF56175.1 hypothetical protein A1O9_07756 [Exophiala aquamarina CBS 119918]